MKKIIFNADDFGPSDFINSGIREGIAAGVINSVSTFVTFGQKNIDAIKELKKDFGDKVKIGLHFTTTAGAPVYQNKKEISSIYQPAGKNYDDRFWLFSSMNLTVVEPEHLRKELNAQLDLLASILGEDVNHLNNHQGFMVFYRPFWEIYKDVARTRNIPMRNPVSFEYTHSYLSDRLPALPITRLGLKSGWKSMLKGNFFKTALKLGNGAKKKRLKRKSQEAHHSNIQMPSNYLMSYFRQASLNIIRHVLDHIREGETVEFLLHPGRGDYSQDNDWGINPDSLDRREKELQVLLDCNLAAMLSHRKIEMTDYRNV